MLTLKSVFFSGTMSVTVRSEGYEDRRYGRMLGGRCKAYIKVNGREYSPKRRGFNVVTVNLRTGTTTPLLVVKTFNEKKSCWEGSCIGNITSAMQGELWTRFERTQSRTQIGAGAIRWLWGYSR